MSKESGRRPWTSHTNFELILNPRLTDNPQYPSQMGLFEVFWSLLAGDRGLVSIFQRSGLVSMEIQRLPRLFTCTVLMLSKKRITDDVSKSKDLVGNIEEYPECLRSGSC